MNLYNLIAVEFGDQSTSARPVEFEFNDAGEPIRILKLVTTCPHCGALNDIDAVGMQFVEDMVINLRCIQCEKGQDDFDKFLQLLPEAKAPTPNAAPNATISVDLERAVGCNVTHAARQMIKPSGKPSVTLDANGSFAPTSTFVDPIALRLFTVEEI